MSDRPIDRALQEFLPEAQEIIETFNRLLLKLDEDRVAGRAAPGMINEAFRSVHTLKALAGSVGLARMAHLSHRIEDLLDKCRLDKVELTAEVIDLLFEAGELFQRIAADIGQGASSDGGSADASGDLLARLEGALARADSGHRDEPAWGSYVFDASLLSVLTEYEEHRLRENVRAGRGLYRVHAAFDLATIDVGLEALKERLKPLGEVITYLPSSESGDPQQIELDLIVGAPGPESEIQAALAGLGVVLRAVPRAGRSTGPQRAPAPTPPRGIQAAPERPPPVATPATPALTPIAVAVLPDIEVVEERVTSIKSASQTVRVDIRKLDHLMNLVGELSLARTGIQGVLDELKVDRERAGLARTLHHEARVLGRKLDEMQAAIIEVRMVPLGQVFDKLSRVVRKISREAGKDIRFVISGAETELDKLLVEELSDPLMHMIRNCIDHGIEPPEVRAQAGKPVAGTVAIAASQRGNHVVIEVEDDGVGLDEAKLVRSAVERGYLDEGAAGELSRREIYNLIFLPGVSTKVAATELSGRGVGMDVVKTNLSRLSGIIDVESEPGLGTRLTLTLPITLAIIQALVIRAAGRTYAVPLNSVLESLLIQSGDVRTIERREVVDLRGQTLPIVRVEDAFRLRREGARPKKSFVVVVGLAQHRVGLVIDELIGQQDIVIKSLGKSLDGIPGIAGATELGGQQTVLVLDVATLVEETLGVGAGEAAS
ncbi:MAG: chemotaxis protein CheA [Myxococcales bacterium]|nr:chemotaxis protein CheA [Myxococcales bacterium]